LRALRPYPGWYFDIAATDTSPVVQLRHLIWDICHTRQLQMSILHPWYNNSKVRLYLGNDLSRPIYIGGCIEPNEFAFINSVLKKGMVMIDIGANDGLFTIFAASKVGKQGRVLAFEPSRREFGRLQSNIQMNHLENVIAISKAASNEIGFAQLKISEYGHEGQNTLGDFVGNVRQSGVQTVETCCLDMVPEVRTLQRLDLIKIDVEGAEHKVLEGAQGVIQNFKPIILLELMDKALRYQGSSATQIVQYLQSLGYIIYDFSATSGKPVLSDCKKHSDNILACPRPLLLSREKTGQTSHFSESQRQKLAEDRFVGNLTLT
jgi:FkbM family methyltransferase